MAHHEKEPEVEQEETLEVKAPGGWGATVKSPSLNLVFTILAFISALWGVWLMMEQRAESKAREDKLAAAITDFAQAQREMNCLIAMPQDKRELEYIQQNSFCKQMARLR
jgi:hypothetical protein